MHDVLTGVIYFTLYFTLPVYTYLHVPHSEKEYVCHVGTIIICLVLAAVCSTCYSHSLKVKHMVFKYTNQNFHLAVGVIYCTSLARWIFRIMIPYCYPFTLALMTGLYMICTVYLCTRRSCHSSPHWNISPHSPGKTPLHIQGHKCTCRFLPSSRHRHIYRFHGKVCQILLHRLREDK